MTVAERILNADDAQIGRRLKGLRIEQGLQAQIVAERLDMTAGNYAHYESGRNRLSFVDLQRFAVALEVTPEDLAVRLGLPLSYSPTALKAAAESPNLAEREAALDAILADPEFKPLFSQIGRKVSSKSLTPGERRLLLTNLTTIVAALYADDD